MSNFKLKLKGHRRGIKFNPMGSQHLSWGEALDPIISIVNEDELKEYFEDYVQWNMSKLEGSTRAEVEDMCRSNIGYWAGYYGVEARTKVENILKAIHPHLGSVNLQLTSQEIFERGKALGRGLKEGFQTQHK